MKFTLVVPVAPERDAPIIESIKNLDYDKSEFHVVVIAGKNPSLNRNKGVDRAKGEFIVFLDDDALIKEDYLNEIERFFIEHPEIDVVGGPQLTPEDDGGFAKISGYALNSKFGAWKLSGRYGKMEKNLEADEKDLTSANLVCRKRVVEKVRFDENLFPAEDPKFISDAINEGFRIAYSPDIVVHHKRRPDFRSLVKQIFNYGKFRPKKERFLETLNQPFFFIPSLFAVYLGLLILTILANPSITGGVIGINTNSISFWWFLPLLAYVLLAILFSVYEGFRNDDLLSVLIIPFIFLTIHLSYGVGMLKGYWDKVVE